MIAAEWQIRIERPAEEIFDFVADLQNEPQFNPDASNVVQKTDGAPGPGTVFEEDFKRIVKYITTIDLYQRPTELGFDARNPRTDALLRFRFTPEDGSTTSVWCRVELTMKGAMRFMEPLMAGPIRKRITSTRGPMLKAALER